MNATIPRNHQPSPSQKPIEIEPPKVIEINESITPPESPSLMHRIFNCFSNTSPNFLSASKTENTRFEQNIKSYTCEQNSFIERQTDCRSHEMPISPSLETKMYREYAADVQQSYSYGRGWFGEPLKRFRFI